MWDIRPFLIPFVLDRHVDCDWDAVDASRSSSRCKRKFVFPCKFCGALNVVSHVGRIVRVDCGRHSSFDSYFQCL